MTEKNKKAPPPAEIFTLKDYQEMRRFYNEMEKAIKQHEQDQMTPEEQDEAFKELSETGEVSEKYKNRMGLKTFESAVAVQPVYDDAGNPVLNENGTYKLEPVTEPPEIRLFYYDKADRKFADKLNQLSKKYQKIISKVNATEEPKKRNNIHRARAIIRELLEAQEVKQALVKIDEIGNIAPWGGMASAEWLLILSRIFNAGKSKAGKGAKNKEDRPEKGKLARIIQPTPGNRHEICQTKEKGNDIITTWSNGKGSKISFEIADADRFINGRYFMRNLFFIIQKMNDQAFPDVVTVSLDEMVNLGMYSRTDGALRGMRTFYRNQKKITINGAIKKTKKKKIYAGTNGSEKGVDGGLFQNLLYDDGSSYVQFVIDPCFNTKFIAPYFTLFPRDAYKMSEKALSLTYYIFYLARQNTRKIKKGGTFTIKMDTIRNYLGFPDVDEVKGRRQKQLIIDPLDKIIDEVERVIGQTPEAQNQGFTITPYVQYTGNVRDYLKGYLEIGLKGNLAKTFIEIAEKQ